MIVCCHPYFSTLAYNGFFFFLTLDDTHLYQFIPLFDFYMYWKRASFIFCLVVYFFALFFYEYGKAWISVAMFGLLLSSFLQSPIREHFEDFWNQKSLVVLTFSVFILPLYLLNSSDLHYYFERVQIRAPFLALPFAFAALTSITKHLYHKLLSIFVVLCFVVALGTFIHYLLNIETVNESYLRAKVMPSVLNHVRLSIMIAMGAYLSFYLFRENFSWYHTFERWIFLVIALSLFVFVHLYSVRSGLIALYVAVLVEIGYYVYSTQNYKRSIGILSILLLSAFLSVRFVPTLNNKWVNTLADLKVYQMKGYPNYNSLTTRFISYEAAIAIVKEAPVLGCGLGDIKAESDQYFRTHYPVIDIPILPHNQFLFWLAATGLVGLLFFSATFFFPLFQRRNWSNKILIVHYAILFFSFQTEPMLETQLGVAYSLLFILLPLTQIKNSELTDSSSL